MLPPTAHCPLPPACLVCLVCHTTFQSLSHPTSPRSFLLLCLSRIIPGPIILHHLFPASSSAPIVRCQVCKKTMEPITMTLIIRSIMRVRYEIVNRKFKYNIFSTHLPDIHLAELCKCAFNQFDWHRSD